jgi:hypothetical protein
MKGNKILFTIKVTVKARGHYAPAPVAHRSKKTYRRNKKVSQDQ